MAVLEGNERVLVLRLGAMGDILHALPAVEALHRSFPGLHIDWLLKPHWMPLLAGNPAIARLIPYRRDSWRGLRRLRQDLRQQRYDVALDLQGLLQSALLAFVSGARHRVGYGREAAREPLAAMFYQTRVQPEATHIVHRHAEVVRALGATEPLAPVWMPPGEPDGALPAGPYVLAAPFAGWASKQWPLGHYSELAALLRPLGLALVLNVAERDRARLAGVDGVHVHCSSIAGLINASRRAAAIVGLDSGPLHLAVALGRPCVALFGPTDPARNGPAALGGGPSMVLRDATAQTSYKRGDAILDCMRRVSPAMVYEAIESVLLVTPEGSTMEGDRS